MTLSGIDEYQLMASGKVLSVIIVFRISPVRRNIIFALVCTTHNRDKKIGAEILITKPKLHDCDRRGPNTVLSPFRIIPKRIRRTQCLSAL